jgi:hypothetical protein
MAKLKPEIKKLWTEELRSGKYKQQSGYLNVKYPDGTVGHCCLGVLCELAVKAGVVIKSHPIVEDHPNFDEYYRFGAPGQLDPSAAILPQEVVDWAFVEADQTTRDPVVLDASDPGPSYTSTLAAVNDSGNYSFDQIADIIEVQL